MSSPKKDSRREFRNTGLVVGAACGVLGLLQWLLHGRLSAPLPLTLLFGASAVLILLALSAPALLRPFHIAWMKLAETLGWVMNRVFLGLVFFVLFTLTGWTARLLRQDLLDRGFHHGRRESYWISRDQPAPRPERYERQF